MSEISLTTVYTCTMARWSPTIGDPNLSGWLTVLAYLVCAATAVGVVRRAELTPRGRWFWRLIVAMMVFLAINKQLDLQTALTAAGRCLSQLQGWYGERRGFQRHFIEALLAIFALILMMGLYLLRRDMRQNGLALSGLIVVGAFVAVRAVGFHHFDVLINQRFLDVRFNVIFELSGLVMIFLNALALLLWPRRADGHSGH